eukprot:2137731-Pleurochrysis_carterae.AAC.2
MMYQSTAPPENAPFSEEELDSTIASLRSLVRCARMTDPILSPMISNEYTCELCARNATYNTHRDKSRCRRGSARTLNCWLNLPGFRLVPLAAVETVDWAALRALLVSSAHLSHKDWARTEAAASRLADIIGGPGDSAFDSMFERVLEGGNWAAAVQAAEARPAKAKPWVVLVTGVNGIRKTSSVYQVRDRGGYVGEYTMRAFSL